MLLIFTYRYNGIPASHSWVFPTLGAQHLCFFLFVGYLTLDLCLWLNQESGLSAPWFVVCSFVVQLEYRVYGFERRVSTFISYLFQCELLLGV